MKENSIEEDIKKAQYFINFIKTDEDYKKENGWHGYYNEEIVELARILDHVLSDNKNIKHKIGYISEICVENSKEHIDDRQSIMKIIKILQNKKI